MSPEEVVWFVNHRYGEQAYLIETAEKYIIYTVQSEWFILKNDYKRFHFYTLYHSNHLMNVGHLHTQSKSNDVAKLVYLALRHDNDILRHHTSWEQFINLWEIFLLGRQVEADIATWNFLCEE